MRQGRFFLVTAASSLGIAASVVFAGNAMATNGASQPTASEVVSSAPANGDIATTEYYYFKPTAF